MKTFKHLLKPAKGKDRFFCPACNGHNLTINNGTGAYNCWNGCSSEDIKTAIRIEYPDFFETERFEAGRTKKAPREVKTTEYIYTDREGDPLIQVRKIVTDEDGSKDIKQFHWTGRTWEWGYGPVKTPDIPLYRYTEIMEAIERREPIVLCEGESTADAFWDKGIPATTAIGGTGKTVVKKTKTIDKQPVTFCERNSKTFESIKPALLDLSEAEVILAPDQDKPGCLHMEMMAELLNVKGWLYAFPDSYQWTRLKDKGGVDLVDWVHDYPKLTKQDILDCVVPEPTHELQSLDPEQQLSLLKSQPIPTAGNKKRPRAAVLARQLHEAHPNLLYVAERKVWMMYEASTTGAWDEIPEELVERLAMQLLEKLGHRRLDSFTPINNAIKFLRTATPAFVNKWEEADKNLLPFTNGVLDLTTGAFLEHHPKYHLTWTLPRPHDPAANQWNNIDTWLDFATQGKSGLRSILECFAAAVLKGRADLQKFLHLMGIGGSGKGTYMKLVTSLIGTNNTVTSNLERFCKNNFEAARMHRKRLVLFADERNKPLSISEFMKLTGQDQLQAERKRKDAFDFTFDGMVILASEAPIFYGEMGYGLKRRTILMPMNARVEDKDRRDLQTDFESELAAFTNHLISLPDEFVSETLRNTEQIQDIKAYYWKARLREDSIAAWMDERVVYSSESEISYMSLYEDYKNYCHESGNQTKSKNKFSDELPEVCELLQWKVFKHKTNSGRVIKGLRIRKRGEYSDYPRQTYDPSTSSNETKVTTLVTTSDDLSDDLKPDCIREVTTVTTCSNLLPKTKKTEEEEQPKNDKQVKNNTCNSEKLRSNFETFKSTLINDFLDSTAKVSRVNEKTFKAKFSNSNEIESHLQFLELAEKIVRNHGYIYNAYGLIFKKGEEVVFASNKDGRKYYGKIESMNFPSYTVVSGDEAEYIHCLNIKKR